MSTRFLFVIFILTFSFTLVSTHNILAQGDFREGYIITATKDTVRGLINYHENSLNYNQCDFKKSSNEAGVKYSPEQILAYKFDSDRFFQSKQVSLPDSTTRQVFLEVLSEGKVTLFKLKEQGYYTLFYLEKEGKLYRINDGRPRKENESWKQLGILNYAMYDCPELRSKLATVEADERSLVKITKQYNACMSEEGASYKESKDWLHLSPSFSGGVAFSTLEVNAHGSDQFEGKYDPSFGPVFELGLDASLQRFSERWALHTGIIMMPTEHTKESSWIGGLTTYNGEVRVKVTQMRIPLGLKFTTLGKKFNFFVNGGASFTTTKKEEVTNKITRYYNGQFYDQINGETKKVIDHLFGSWIGVGSNVSLHKKFGVYTEIRYEATQGFFYIDEDLTSRINNILVVIGVKIP